jgi:hypothetical protein
MVEFFRSRLTRPPRPVVLGELNVRLVEVARQGPTKRDGIALLQDTRQPYRLHLDGVYKLSRENRVTGTMPQLGGVRKCSQKSKGVPQDMWRANEFGDRPYIHAIGFNVNEYTRITRDSAYSMGGQRIPMYPVHEWGWSRQDRIDYLYRRLGVVWPKSCCRHCPYAGSKTGWPEQLARFAALPVEATEHVIDEYVCLAYVGPNTVHSRVGSMPILGWRVHFTCRNLPVPQEPREVLLGLPAVKGGGPVAGR